MQFEAFCIGPWQPSQSQRRFFALLVFTCIFESLVICLFPSSPEIVSSSTIIIVNFFGARVLSRFSHVWLFCNPIGCNPPGSSVHGDSPGENTRVPPVSSSGDPPYPEFEPSSLMSPSLAGRFFTSGATWVQSQEIYWFDPSIFSNVLLSFYPLFFLANSPFFFFLSRSPFNVVISF